MGLLKKEFIIESQKSDVEVIDALREKTDENAGRFQLSFEAGKEFTGSVHGSGFDLKLIKGSQRNYKPIANGVIKKNTYSTSIDVTIKPSGWTIFLLVSMLIMLIFLSYRTIIVSIERNNFQAFYILPGLLLMLVLNFLLHRYKVNNLKNKIEEVFE